MKKIHGNHFIEFIFRNVISSDRRKSRNLLFITRFLHSVYAPVEITRKLISAKRTILSLIFVIFSFSAFAVNWEDFSLSVEPLFGLKCGQIDEYVFLKESNFSNDKLSELNWEIKPELYYGIKIQGAWRRFFEESYFSTGIPMETGLMMDSDWQNNQPTAVALENAQGRNYKTAYSEHDNHLDYDINFGFKGGYKFKIFDWFTAKPAIAFEYQNIKFTGKNGKGWYGYGSDENQSFRAKNGYYAAYNDSENQTVIKFSGRIITYNRIADYLWLGSDFSFIIPCEFLKNFTFDTGFFFAPYVYAVSYDSHLGREYDFADKTTGFFAAFKWNLGTEYKINERHSILLSANYFYMRVLRGDDYQKKSSETTYNKSNDCDGGAGAKYFDMTLSYRFKIF